MHTKPCDGRSPSPVQLDTLDRGSRTRRTTMTRHMQAPNLSRRTFLTTTSAALVGAVMGGLAPQSEAAKRDPKRGGVLQFGTRLDAAGLDSHRNNQYHTSHPIAALYNGLTDIDQ